MAHHDESMRTTLTNGGTVIAAAVFVMCMLGSPCVVTGQEIEIGSIDLYGLSRVPARQVRDSLTLALAALSADRDPELLATLRERALRPLMEMARWKSEGHAQPGFFILVRIAGYSDEAAYELWERRERDTVIDAASREP